MNALLKININKEKDLNLPNKNKYHSRRDIPQFLVATLATCVQVDGKYIMHFTTSFYFSNNGFVRLEKMVAEERIVYNEDTADEIKYRFISNVQKLKFCNIELIFTKNKKSKSAIHM
jgi:hypothetical protein